MPCWVLRRTLQRGTSRGALVGQPLVRRRAPPRVERGLSRPSRFASPRPTRKCGSGGAGAAAAGWARGRGSARAGGGFAAGGGGGVVEAQHDQRHRWLDVVVVAEPPVRLLVDALDTRDRRFELLGQRRAALLVEHELRARQVRIGTIGGRSLHASSQMQGTAV